MEGGEGNLQHRTAAAFCLKWSIGSVIPAHTAQVLILWTGWRKGEMAVKGWMPSGNKEP